MATTLYESGIEVLHSRTTGESLLDIVAEDADLHTAQLVNEGRITATPDLVTVLDTRVIKKLASSVRDCINYQYGTHPWDSDTDGDCFSYTYTLDKLGEQLGYDRRIAFCNGHAFNLFVNKYGAVHMLHGETPGMQVADVVTSEWAQRMLMKHHFDAIVSQEDPAQWISLETHWLRFHFEAAQSGKSRKVELPWLNANLPAMAVMLPDFGIQALRNYSRFDRALEAHDLESTTSAVSELIEANPQVETRVKINDQMKVLEKNVRMWAKDPSIATESIVECLALFDACMPVKTKSLSVFLGDALRTIARIRDDRELADVAMAYYRIADQQSKNRHDRTLVAKMGRAREAAADYDGASQQSRFVGRVAFSSLLVV